MARGETVFRLTLLLSLHDVTPRHVARLVRAEALFQRLGVTRVTYLLVPRFHGGWAIEDDEPFRAWCRAPRPFTVRWCLHGYSHQEVRRSGQFSLRDWGNRRFLTAGEGEFLSLGDADTKVLIDAGTNAFEAYLGVRPTGFVAPAWLFNRALISALRDRGFAWTEDHWRIYDLRRGEAISAPVITWATRTPFHRVGSTRLAPVLRWQWSHRPIIRIAVHPLDFDHPRVVRAIERIIAAALRDRALRDYEWALSQA
jgi:predicted deacetylase